MSVEKEKENETVNSNFYNLPLHQLYSSGNTPYNPSPMSSPSVGNYAIPLYGNNGNNPNTNSGNGFVNRFPMNLQQQGQQMMGNHTPTEVNVTSMASPGATAHLVRQLNYAQISRQSSSPHHHARAAAAMARSTPVSSAVTITDPNDPNKLFSNGRFGGVAEKEEDNEHIWTSLDMGGMGLKNISPTLCNYHFLTALYLNHNNLAYLMPSLAQLTNLKILDASGNKLSVLPPELGLLYNLRELLLFDNNLVSIPTEFGNLYQLETLGLEGNPLQADLKNILIKDGTQALIMSLRENAPVGMPPPHRDWLLIESDTIEESDKFTILCYNILCQKYATPQAYGYTPSWALNWEYRKELLVSEILGYNSDVICLQEMEMGQYEDNFKEHFKKMGDYDSVFIPKTRAKTMSEKERRVVDGCATFYKSTRFNLIDHELIEYNQKALQRPDFKQTADIYNRIMNKDNVAILTMLEDKHTKQRLLVANTHTHWNPSDADVKLVQVGILMEEMKVFAAKHVKSAAKNSESITYASVDKIPTIICGDYNSSADSGVYEYFSKGVIQHDHSDFGNHSYGKYTTEGLSHPLSLKSAYGNELSFTNYTPDFKGILDYIWFTTNTIDLVSLLGPIDKEYLSKVVGFPNSHFPSDHIPLMTEFKFKSQIKKEAIKVDFSSTHKQNNNRLK